MLDRMPSGKWHHLPSDGRSKSPVSLTRNIFVVIAVNPAVPVAAIPLVPVA
jgi:hypothetical protein